LHKTGSGKTKLLNSSWKTF